MQPPSDILWGGGALSAPPHLASQSLGQESGHGPEGATQMHLPWTASPAWSWPPPENHLLADLRFPVATVTNSRGFRGAQSGLKRGKGTSSLALEQRSRGACWTAGSPVSPVPPCLHVPPATESLCPSSLPCNQLSGLEPHLPFPFLQSLPSPSLSPLLPGY